MPYNRTDHLLTNETGVLQGSQYYISTHEVERPDLMQYLISCGHYYCTAGYDVCRDYYKYLLVAYVAAGELRVDTGGKSCVAKAGDVVVLDCQTPHRYWAGPALEFVWMHAEGNLASQLCREIVRHSGPVIQQDDVISSYVKGSMDCILHAFASGAPMGVGEQSALIYDIFCRIYAHTMTNRTISGNSLVMAVIQFMRYNLVNPLTPADIGGAVGMPTEKLEPLFEQSTGCPLMEYLTKLRIGLAQHLMATTQDNLTEIAAAVGYNDPTCFKEDYVRLAGQLPHGR